jgi:hypothetical protein
MKCVELLSYPLLSHYPGLQKSSLELLPLSCCRMVCLGLVLDRRIRQQRLQRTQHRETEQIALEMANHLVMKVSTKAQI